LAEISNNPAKPWNVQGSAQRALEEIAKGGDFNKKMVGINDDFSQLLQKHGYDGLRMWEGGEGDMSNHISLVVFDPAKVIPTGSPIQVTKVKAFGNEKVAVSEIKQPESVSAAASANIKLGSPR